MWHPVTFEQLDDASLGHGLEPDDPAARPDRLQNLFFLIGDQHEDRVGLRFFEGLQQRVLSGLIHPVGLFDHEDLEPALERGTRGIGDDGLPDHIYRYQGALGRDVMDVGIALSQYAAASAALSTTDVRLLDAVHRRG